MSIHIPHRVNPAGESAPKQVEYPATFHFRVIVEPQTFDETALAALLAAYRVVEPLAVSQASSAGRYRAYSVSVEIESQAALHAFDAALKSVPGVRMVL
jgi:putative lipoic acid-binding regulatory protein